jgi:2-polyprenyl-6-methoxyphenol hydroxylase-like FAD-dependent oxidoreductase
MAEHAVVVAGGGPTGVMLAAELTLAGTDVVIVERRASFAAMISGLDVAYDGHVAWVGDGTDAGLREALTTWFGNEALSPGRARPAGRIARIDAVDGGRS